MKITCKQCKVLIKEYEYEGIDVLYCNCQNDLQCDFDKERWEITNGS